MRPDFVKEEHLTFLDELRESGVVNMFGAGEYIVDEFIVDEFELDKAMARQVLAYWMKTFGQEDR